MHDRTQRFLRESLAVLQSPLPVPQIAPIAGPVAPVDRDPARRCAVILSPHPDDECLTAALAWRLQEESGWQIINIAVTLGSARAERARRFAELSASQRVLGYDLVLAEAEGFDAINPAARDADPVVWATKVQKIAALLARFQPDLVLMPNEQDANATHQGCFFLGMDALASMPQTFTTKLAFTEYWAPNVAPNMMAGLSVDQAAVMLEALCCYVGEVARNPYHRRLPAYLIDNVRRGSELVSGKGVAAAPLDFAMIYHVDAWRDGHLVPSSARAIVAPEASIEAALFAF